MCKYCVPYLDSLKEISIGKTLDALWYLSSGFRQVLLKERDTASLLRTPRPLYIKQRLHHMQHITGGPFRLLAQQDKVSFMGSF